MRLSITIPSPVPHREKNMAIVYTSALRFSRFCGLYSTHVGPRTLQRNRIFRIRYGALHNSPARMAVDLAGTSAVPIRTLVGISHTDPKAGALCRRNIRIRT